MANQPGLSEAERRGSQSTLGSRARSGPGYQDIAHGSRAEMGLYHCGHVPAAAAGEAVRGV